MSRDMVECEKCGEWYSYRDGCDCKTQQTKIFKDNRNMKYRKIPVVIDAFKLDAKMSMGELPDWF